LISSDRPHRDADHALDHRTSLFPDQHLIRIGYLISAAIPVGITSVIWTAIVKGIFPVSLVTVNLDTIIAPVAVPITLHCAGLPSASITPPMIIDLLRH